MDAHVALLIQGIALGLPAGLLPGPLLTLVISEAVHHGRHAGMRVAAAPLFSDAPIIAVTVLVLSQLAAFHGILGAISLVGAYFLCLLAYRSFSVEQADAGEHPRSLAKGITANVLNPNPYLFWFSVGAPLLVEAWQTNATAAVTFLAAFYTSLIGAKIVVAVLAAQSRAWLDSQGYKIVARLLGALLLGMAAWLAIDGLQLLGVL
ncbi:MAG: LysE family transporter [Thermoplasmatota archaeon]